MAKLGVLLYPIMVIILIWMWGRVKGWKLEEIVSKSSVEHHAINEIFAQHPTGGSWKEFQQWVDRHDH